jgi:hypothetical protein
MKIKQLFGDHPVAEAYTDEDINDYLESKGYKYIGGGVDQSAWLEPGTGLILKIFGTDVKQRGSSKGVLSREQKLFKVFADYCMRHENNQFLPNFLGWEPFQFKGKTYLQIRMERLFPIDDDDVAEALAGIGSEASVSDDFEDFLQHYLNTQPHEDEETEIYDGLEKLILHVGKDGLKKLWLTIHDLSHEAKRHGFSSWLGDAIDLHQDNFMYGSDGHIVISDPYHAG